MERKQKPIVASEVFKGTKGLTMEFVKNAPPADVYEDTNFGAIIRLRNQGAYDIGFDNNGILVITPETGYFDISPYKEEKEENKNVWGEDETRYFRIRGRSIYDNVGGEEMVDINLKARKTGSLSLVHPSTIFATACYAYKTELSTSICIDPDIYNLKPGEKACQVKDLSFASGQGGPVAITKVELGIIPVGEDKVKPRILVYIENKGKGEIVKDYEEACGKEISKGEQEKYFNLIKMEAHISGKEGMQLDCIPKKPEQKTPEEKLGFVRLKGKTDVVRCELKEGQEGVPKDADAYVTPLTINISYGYIETITKNFNIKKS